MCFGKKNVIIRTVVISSMIFAMVTQASALVEISDFFSDFTSADVTVNSTQDFQGTVVFQLFYEGTPVESHEVPVGTKEGKAVTRVILWEKKPANDYYTARVSVTEGGKVLASDSYQVSYGTVSLPNFHVVDFSPTNSGVQLLLRPFNPSAVDIEIELLDNNDIVYSKTQEDVSLTTNTEIDIAWPFLLINNKDYIVRAKIFTHRLYAQPLINTYVAYFKATDDVEILRDDITVDEYGASVTVRGKSQVPFDGYIFVRATNRATNETQTFSTQMEEILVTGKEDTAGVVWKGLVPGTYDVSIQAVNKDNVTIDKYETAMRISEYSNVSKAVPAKSTPGFEALLFIIALAAWRFRCR